jgi:hypothetical protein
MKRLNIPVIMDRIRKLIHRKSRVIPILIKIKGRPSFATGNLFLILEFSKFDDGMEISINSLLWNFYPPAPFPRAMAGVTIRDEIFLFQPHLRQDKVTQS